MQAEQSILDRFRRRYGMDTSLEWKIVLDQRRYISRHRTVGGEEEDRNTHGTTK
jgi:hypothetical protein